MGCEKGDFLVAGHRFGFAGDGDRPGRERIAFFQNILIGDPGHARETTACG
jgi:hypothetical protein